MALELTKYKTLYDKMLCLQTRRLSLKA